MANIRKLFAHLKVTVLTIIVALSFIMSSIGWRHLESSQTHRILWAAFILVTMYTLIVLELVNRNLAALIGAAMAVAAHDCLVEFADMEEILKWLDLETLSLLFGMMIIVNVLGSSGVFDYLAVWAYQKSGGNFWLLISIMSVMTAFFSAYIDNVSTMLLMTPTIIKLSELEHIDPRYILMTMIIMSNIGGASTPIGDPPNLIIIGDPLTSQLGIDFVSFTAYATPCAILNVITVLVYMRLLYGSKESFRLKNDANNSEAKLDTSSSGSSMFAIEFIQGANKEGLVDELKLLNSLKTQLSDAQHKLTNDSVKLMMQIDDQHERLSSALEEMNRRRNTLSLPHQDKQERRGSRLTDDEISELLHKHHIRSKPILIQSLLILAIAVILFFVQSIPGITLTLGWVSLFAGLTLLVMSSSLKVPHEDGDKSEEKSDHEDNFEAVISKIEWSTLMFFFALFIVMEVMSKLGLISYMGNQITDLIDLVPAGQLRSICAISIILWASGIASALIDNVPFTSMMIKVLGSMYVKSGPLSSAAHLDVRPLVFALVFGACFGGNATLIGASANLVTSGISARYGYPISFNSFCKFAAPITLITFIVSNIYLVMVFVVLGL